MIVQLDSWGSIEVTSNSKEEQGIEKISHKNNQTVTHSLESVAIVSSEDLVFVKMTNPDNSSSTEEEKSNHDRESDDRPTDIFNPWNFIMFESEEERSDDCGEDNSNLGDKILTCWSRKGRR